MFGRESNASPLLYDDDLLMPPVPSSRGDPKRPHTGDEGDKPSKRARNSNGGDDAPDGDEEPASNIVHLSDRVRFSWQSKGKWKAKGSRSKSAPSRAPLDSSTPGSSSQPMSASAIEGAPALVDPAIAEALSSGATLAAIATEARPNEQELALQAEVARLRKELEDKNKAITRHENVMDTVRTSMQCGICYEPFARPCVVVPCGHISCQNCLIEWFTSPAPNPDSPRQGRKRKTCPHCRGAVRSRPVELFGLAPAAAALAGQSDHSAPVPAFGSATSAPDPWAKLFPAAVRHPLRDEEDGVLRCPDCFHEVWDGECVRCGRMFSDSGRSAFGSDDGSISIYGDGVGSVYGAGGSIYGGTLYGDSDGEGDSVYGSEPEPHHGHQPFVPPPHMYDSYEDEDDDDSFIDDSELPRPPPAAYFHHYAPSDSVQDGEQGDGYHSARGGDGYRSPVADVIRVSSSDSSSDSDSDSDSNEDEEMGDSDLDVEPDEEEDDFLPPRGRRGHSADTDTTAPATGVETAEEADDEEESEVDPNATIDLDPDEDEDEEDEAPVRPMGRGRRAAAAGWGWGAPQPVVENTRARARARRLRRIDSSDLGSDSGSEYFSE